MHVSFRWEISRFVIYCRKVKTLLPHYPSNFAQMLPFSYHGIFVRFKCHLERFIFVIFNHTLTVNFLNYFIKIAYLSEQCK